MKEEDIKKLNIYEKLSMITEEIGVIEKGLKVQVNKNASYKAVGERDVLDAVKPLEKKYRVFSFPIKREVIDRNILVKESEYNETITRTNTLFMRIETTYRFVNSDKPEEYIETITYGDGLDTGDKAPGKAMTYADKYALMKAYKLSTGDDPDKEASPETTPTPAAPKKATPKQIEMIKSLVEDIPAMLKYCKVKKIEDLTLEQASEIIKKKTKEEGK